MTNFILVLSIDSLATTISASYDIIFLESEKSDLNLVVDLNLLRYHFTSHKFTVEFCKSLRDFEWKICWYLITELDQTFSAQTSLLRRHICSFNGGFLEFWLLSSTKNLLLKLRLLSINGGNNSVSCCLANLMNVDDALLKIGAKIVESVALLCELLELGKDYCSFLLSASTREIQFADFPLSVVTSSLLHWLKTDNLESCSLLDSQLHENKKNELVAHTTTSVCVLMVVYELCGPISTQIFVGTSLTIGKGNLENVGAVTTEDSKNFGTNLPTGDTNSVWYDGIVAELLNVGEQDAWVLFPQAFTSVFQDCQWLSSTSGGIPALKHTQCQLAICVRDDPQQFCSNSTRSTTAISQDKSFTTILPSMALVVRYTRCI